MLKFKFINKDNISKLPKSPGIYAFRKGAKLLYIGKAANLRERVKNHFQQPAFRDNLFINQVDKIGFIKTDSEIEALILEAKLIKKYQPKYNIVWRDDKNYFYVGIAKEDFPTVFITHQPAKIFASQKLRRASLKIDYVGPFVEGRALKQTLNTLRRVFPFRTCKTYSGKLYPHTKRGQGAKNAQANEVISRYGVGACLWYQLNRCPGPCLLSSKLAEELPELEIAIKKESQRNAKNLKKILEGRKNQVLKDLKRGMKQASKIRDFEKAAKIRDQIQAMERILSHARLLEATEPEKESWEQTEKQLKGALNVKGKVSRIEAYDISDIQGKNAVGSMVTFINGKPNKNFYRKFKIRIEEKPNDTAMIKEILTRRFNHSEWGWPDLILIDGGKPQLSAAINSKAQSASRRTKNINKFDSSASAAKFKVIALAKRKNELYIEDQKKPVLLKKLPREIFNLILQLRDEAHRFAITYHRKLREKF